MFMGHLPRYVAAMLPAHFASHYPPVRSPNSRLLRRGGGGRTDGGRGVALGAGAATLRRRGTSTSGRGFRGHVIRHIGNDNTRVEQQRRLESQRGLVVQQLLPPVRGNEFGQN